MGWEERPGKETFLRSSISQAVQKAPNWVREQKVAALGVLSPRRQANLYPPLAKGVPTQPSPPPYTPPSPPLQQGIKKSREGSGENRTTSNLLFSSRRIGLRGSVIVHQLGREVQGAGDHSPRSSPGGGSQPRTIGRGWVD